jgi:tetratricopeptide (TPR) repeat protein
MVEQPAGDRLGGIHADGDLTVSGKRHRVAGGDIVDAQTYIETAILEHAAPSAPLGLLPQDVADFTGRDSELAELEAELLATHGQAVVISAVYGKPGVGKSALAVHLAHKLAAQFPDGQVYVELRGADQQPLPAETALTELLRILRVPADQQPTSLDGKAALWRQQVARKRVLVVLDNAHDDAQVRPLLPGSPTCAVIVTSRAVLATLGAKPLLLDILDPDQALEFLGKIAGPQRIEAERQAALAVVAVCGGLPLALRIAGAKLAARADWPVAKLAERLADTRRRLTELGMGDLDVRASFQLSYQELPDQQARAFRLLSLWPGADFHPWVLMGLLRADVKDEEELVDGLVAAQLVEPAAVQGRYRLHDLLRLFASEQLDRQEVEPEREAMWARLAEAAATVTHIVTAAWTPPELRQEEIRKVRITPEKALSLLEAERDGLVALAGLAAKRGPVARAWELAEDLTPFFTIRGYWADQERVNRWAVQAARQAGDRAAEGRALNHLGLALGDQGHRGQAIDCFHQALAVFRELGDHDGEGSTLNNLGTVLRNQGRLEDAIDCDRQALAVCRELGDRQGEGSALTNMGVVLADQGRLEEAIDCHQRALVVFCELGDRRGEGPTLNNLGGALARHGHREQATDCFRQALAISREVGDRDGEGSALNNLGRVLADQGHLEQAIDACQQALAIRRKLGDRDGEGSALTNLGSALAREGHLEQATDCFRQALAICRELGDRDSERYVLNYLGSALAGQGHLEQAIDSYRQALTIFREVGDRHGEAQLLNDLGVVLAMQGHREQAIESCRQALTIFEQLRAPEAAKVAQTLTWLSRPRRRWWPFRRSRG